MNIWMDGQSEKTQFSHYAFYLCASCRGCIESSHFVDTISSPLHIP